MKVFHKNIASKNKFILLVAVALILVIASFFTAPNPTEAPDRLEVSFVDVGQGDCAVLNFPNGRKMIIDGGEAESFEIYAKPYLEKQGMTHFDFAMLSHYHSDHSGGIQSIMSANGADNYLVPMTDIQGYTRDRFSSAAASVGVSLRELARGSELEIDDQTGLEVLFPAPQLYENVDENVNNESIVLRLTYGSTSFLFTGDLEADAERVLVNSSVLDADVLKVGHHGSSTSSCVDFIEAVSPSYAVISAGENNRYGHPHYETTAALDRHKIKTYRTDIDGSIKFRVSENKIEEILTEPNDTAKEQPYNVTAIEIIDIIKDLF